MMDMTKFELIESVRELNPTALIDFLAQFSEDELKEYLDHLMEADLSHLHSRETASALD